VAPTDDLILAAVAREATWMEELTARLVAARTTLGAEEPGQAIMREALRDSGLEPQDVPLDAAALRGHPGASPFSWDVAGKAGVVARFGPEAPARAGARSLILNGHVDVVGAAPEVLWRTPPWEAVRDGEWLHGRGAGDMKAGLAAMVGAVRALRALGARPAAPVQLQSVVEEECTGHGALALVLAGAAADGAVVVEPTGGAVWTAQVGVLWFAVRILGRPAHAGWASEAGNAIEGSFPVIQALRALEAQLNAERVAPFLAHAHPINLNVGVISGGDWPSTVAGEAVTRFRLGLYPGQRVEALRERVEATVEAASVGLPAGYTAEVTYDGFACEGYALAGDEPIVGAVGAAAARVTGATPPVQASTATTDARQFALYAGTPAVSFGPLAADIHGVDERVHVPSILTTAQVLALLVRDWCGLE
jgi:acetylornithine deacetylase